MNSHQNHVYKEFSSKDKKKEDIDLQSNTDKVSDAMPRRQDNFSNQLAHIWLIQRLVPKPYGQF